MKIFAKLLNFFSDSTNRQRQDKLHHIQGKKNSSTVPKKLSLDKSTCMSETTPGVGNYFRPRNTLLLYKCLAGHISVKKAKPKLKNYPSQAGCGPLAVCCPLLNYTLSTVNSSNNFFPLFVSYK